MKNKLKEGFGFHKTGIKLLTILHQTDSSTIPLTMIYGVLQAAYPYLGLFLSAILIDFLIGNQFRNALIIAFILVSCNFVFGLLLDLLEQTCKYKSIKAENKLRILIREKALNLDYESMENTGVLEKINTSEYTMRMYGGIGTLLLYYQSLLSGFLSAIAAVAMVGILCLAKPIEVSDILSIIASTPISLALFIIILGVILTTEGKANKEYNKKHKKNLEEHLTAERQIDYMYFQVFFDYTKGKVIRLFSMKDMLLERHDKWKNPIRKVYVDMCKMTENISTIETILNAIFTTFAYMLVLIKILVGAITIGSFTKYAGAMSQFNQALMSLVKENEKIRLLCGYLYYFIDFMGLENKRETGTIPIEKRLDNEYEIEFHDVSFSYPGNNDRILDHVSCKITLKDKMAVVGRNGAGKTTFIKLLCRLYDPTEGYITLNGIDIKKYNYEEYLNLFSVVFQDFNMFAFVVKENVAASKEVEEEKIWYCLEQSGIKERIKNLPEQLETPLFKHDSGGVEVSGGEAQKLAIARAIYKDAPFVILDEPTAALDPVSEYEIYSKFDELVKDKTSIYISHRMSSCRFCDDIIVFHEGRIVERGNHEKLMKENNMYSRLWNAQAQYYA